MSVFVTVGTTKFEELVEAVATETFQKLLLSKGYNHLVIQLGRGIYEPNVHVEGMSVEWYRLKPSLQQDMKNATLIISHGGAGCILESLSLKKPLIVAVNENLMNNHQMELARQLANDGYLVYSKCNSLYETLQELNPTNLKHYTEGNPELFGSFLDSVMGFEEHK